MMKISSYILPLVLFLFLGSTFAQEAGENDQIQELKISSTILNEDRSITLYLPNDYASSNKAYPVLYLLDGRTHFKHATGAVEFLSDRGTIPNLIIVSIHNVDRNRDFSPVYDESVPTSGGAEKFLNFISDELNPYLDEHYRTSGFRVLMGHSFGGTFAVYSLLDKPELFDGYIAVSPYLRYAESYLIKEARESLKSFKKERKYFYMTVGNEPLYFEALSEFSTLMKTETSGTVDFQYMKMMSENHGTIPYISLFDGLRFVFSDWPLPQSVFKSGLETIDSHYQRVSVKYGLKRETPELLINALGYNYLQNQEIEKAISVFEENVNRHPGSANVYDSLGEAYEGNDQFKLAAKNYQKAFEIGSKANDRNQSIYKKNMERVQQK